MRVQSYSGRETLPAKFTLVRTFLGMGFLVHFQWGPLGEAFPTKFTNVRFFSRVNPHVFN